MTTKVEQIQIHHQIGYPKLVSLFRLSDKELKYFMKEVVRSFVGNDKEHLFCDSAEVRRTIVDGKIDSILITYYDSINITWLGINYKPEHGVSQKVLDFGSKVIDLQIPEPKEEFKI